LLRRVVIVLLLTLFALLGWAILIWLDSFK